MSNPTVPAAAEGMPSLTRRLFLRSAAIAAPLAALPALAASAEHDPLIALIHCYRQQMALYNTSALSLSPDEDDALALRTWRPPYDLLCESPPAATSLAGVQEAAQDALGRRSANAMASELGPLLTATGSERERMIMEALETQSSRAASAAEKSKRAAIAKALVQGGMLAAGQSVLP